MVWVVIHQMDLDTHPIGDLPQARPVTNGREAYIVDSEATSELFACFLNYRQTYHIRHPLDTLTRHSANLQAR